MEQSAIRQRFSTLPGAVVIGEFDALGKARMAASPKDVKPARMRIGEVFALQSHEGRGCRMVVTSQFQCKAIRLVFPMSTERHPNGLEEQKHHLGYHQKKRKGSHIG